MSSGPEQQRGPVYYAPNQQTVRPDGSGPGTPPEGSGGSGAAPQAALTSLDAMSKDELLAEAQRLGLSPANASMSKAELRTTIDAGPVAEETEAQ